MASERQLSNVLSDFARTMVTDFPIQGILEHLVKEIVEILPITAAGVTLIAPNTSPRYVAASNESALTFERLQTELGEGPCLVAYQSGRAVAVPDLRADDRFPRFGPKAHQAGLGAVFTFPLHQGDRQLGALDLYRDSPGLLNDDDMATAQTLADVTAAYLVNAQSRADLQDSSDRSRESAMHDALTGLPNRVLLLERLDHSLLRGRRSGKIVAVLFVDLDQFKVVNDIYGHQMGDELLIAVARRLTDTLRPGDTLARMSGDEFVILCEDLDEAAHAESIATRLGVALAQPFVVSGVAIDISASIGIAFTGSGAEVPDQLLRDADIAMYQAKRKGGARQQVIDLREQRLTERRTSLRRDLSGASGRGELRTEYQPIVRSADGMISGVEAFLRWDHPLHGLIPPMTLIPLAEQSGLITEVGRWVLERACADRRRWTSDAAYGNLGITVNVSAHQLMGPDFVAMVSSVLTASQTRPEYLTIEITENVFVQDSERALVVLNELKQLGVLVALDDFGSGHSSLNYLQRFPLDVVKIDRGFIAALAEDPTTRAVVSATIGLAHALGMAVVTEGVETVEQKDVAATLGSESCQGYYFARPMSANDLETLTSSAPPNVALRLPVLV